MGGLVKMMLELLFYNDYSLLEGPVYDEKRDILYCVAIRYNQVIAIHLASRLTQTVDVGCVVGCVVLQEDGSLLVAKKDGIFRLVMAADAAYEKDIFLVRPVLQFICQPQQDMRMRYNDGKLDDRGRFLVDYMGDTERMEHQGGVFCVEGTKARTVIEGTTVANGMGFSIDGRYFYFIDTPTKTVLRYDYDQETGELHHPVPAAFLTGSGSPDGMCVYKDDTLLVCEWGGSAMSRWNPFTGEEIARYEFPVTNVTSCCIGKNDCIYVTTARCKGKEEPLAGGIFRLEL